MVHRGSAWGLDDAASVGTPVPTWRDALRWPTREAHGALDRALTGPPGRIEDSDDYVRVVRTLHALHARSEDRLRRWVRTSAFAAGRSLEPAVPERAGLYAGDLRVLGVATTRPDAGEAARGTPAREAPAVGDAEGLALLYLLTGSSAGARVLLRGLPDDVPLAARRGLTDAGGPAAVRSWQVVRRLLASPAQEPLATRAAEEATALFTWLRTHAEERAA